mgnify:CR=1 FL=1
MLLPAKKCTICKKEFIGYLETWGYKRGENLFCSWSCLREWDRTHSKQAKAEQRDKIIQGIKDGLTVNEIVATTGASRTQIIYWVKKAEGKGA